MIVSIRAPRGGSDQRVGVGFQQPHVSISAPRGECWTAAGFDERSFLRRLRLFQGQISAVFACKEDPARVIILKGNKPLAFRYHRKCRAIISSSLEAHLDEAIEDERGWRELDIPPMSLLVLDTDDLGNVVLKPITFKAQSRVARAIQEEAP